MECPKCHFENPDDSSFCGKCSAPLPSLEDISASSTETMEKTPDELTRGTTFASRYEVINQLEYLMSIPSGDIVSIPVLRLDPMWDPLRQHPRFKRLLEEN
jgi:hypothetical protein